MVMMRIYNKYEIALCELIDATQKTHGVPKEIVVTTSEAKDILEEIRWFLETKRSMAYQVTSAYSEDNVHDLEVNQLLMTLDHPECQRELINRWRRGTIKVQFSGVPINIVDHD